MEEEVRLSKGSVKSSLSRGMTQAITGEGKLDLFNC